MELTNAHILLIVLISVVSWFAGFAMGSMGSKLSQKLSTEEWLKGMLRQTVNNLGMDEVVTVSASVSKFDIDDDDGGDDEKSPNTDPILFGRN